MSSVEARLQEYRDKKLREKRSEEQKQRLWDIVTLAGIRNRWVAAPIPRGRDGSTPEENEEEADDGDYDEDVEEEEEEEQQSICPQTPLDAAILLVKVLIWLNLFYLAVYVEFGAIFVLTSGFAFIWLNLGRRRRGAPSAYSVFNPNCEAIDGTLTGEQIDQNIRHGIR